jgi:hypothetical protein
MTTRVLRWAAAILAAGTLVWGGSAVAADAPHWATGTNLQRKLATDKVSIQWAGNPLRRAIRSLSQAVQVAILIDRRVDPDQKLDLSLKDVPLGAALQAIAGRLDLGVSRLGNVVYLGPASVAERLPAVAKALEKDVRRLPTAVQRKYLSTRRLAWDDLAVPRDLLAGLARDSGLSIAGLENVPHDLWAAADLPPLSLIDRLTLIAIQFDLSFKVADGGRRLEVVAAPSE